MIHELDQDDHFSSQRYSINESVKRSNSDERLSAMGIEEEEAVGPLKASQIPRLRRSKQFSFSLPAVNQTGGSSSVLKWNSSLASETTARAVVRVPLISRRSVQGVLVRFFRNGDAHHPGVSMGINELELKSWEAFLNYLNRQKKLIPFSGGIKHVYSLTGREIRSISKFQARQSYVVASGPFIRTNYVHLPDVWIEEAESVTRWRSPPTNAEQIFLLPYSRMNVYQTMFFNRTLLPPTFEQWLHEPVTESLARFIGQRSITHCYAITKFAFTEVKERQRKSEGKLVSFAGEELLAVVQHA